MFLNLKHRLSQLQDKYKRIKFKRDIFLIHYCSSEYKPVLIDFMKLLLLFWIYCYEKKNSLIHFDVFGS